MQGALAHHPSAKAAITSVKISRKACPESDCANFDRQSGVGYAHLRTAARGRDPCARYQAADCSQWNQPIET